MLASNLFSCFALLEATRLIDGVIEASAFGGSRTLLDKVALIYFCVYLKIRLFTSAHLRLAFASVAAWPTSCYSFCRRGVEVGVRRVVGSDGITVNWVEA